MAPNWRRIAEQREQALREIRREILSLRTWTVPEGYLGNPDSKSPRQVVTFTDLTNVLAPYLSPFGDLPKDEPTEEPKTEEPTEPPYKAEQWDSARYRFEAEQAMKANRIADPEKDASLYAMLALSAAISEHTAATTAKPEPEPTTYDDVNPQCVCGHYKRSHRGGQNEGDCLRCHHEIPSHRYSAACQAFRLFKPHEGTPADGPANDNDIALATILLHQLGGTPDEVEPMHVDAVRAVLKAVAMRYESEQSQRGLRYAWIKDWLAQGARRTPLAEQEPFDAFDPRRIDCRSCGTTNAKCMERIKAGGKACCGTCAYTDTHPVVIDSADQETKTR